MTVADHERQRRRKKGVAAQNILHEIEEGSIEGVLELVVKARDDLQQKTLLKSLLHIRVSTAARLGANSQRNTLSSSFAAGTRWELGHSQTNIQSMNCSIIDNQ